MLDDRRFFKHGYTSKPIVTKFKFIESDATQEEDGSNDSGVWVAKWMQLSYMWPEYLDEVNEKTRMKLALDLVMGEQNPKSDAIKALSISTWDKIVGRTAAKLRMKKKKKPAEKEKQLSPSISF